ncbi:NHL repeat-containing protein, partial [Acrasis kona]
MRHHIVCLVLIAALQLVLGANITTFAGSGTSTVSPTASNIVYYSTTNFLSTSSYSYSGGGMAIDYVNNLLYIADTSNHRILVVNRTSTYMSVLVNSAGAAGSTGDGGPATSAMLSNPTGVAVDPVNNIVYVADAGNNYVRYVNITSMTIDAFAGSASNQGYSGDGAEAILATLNTPTELDLDPTNKKLYISDYTNQNVRVVDLTSNFINTVAGSSAYGSSSGNGGSATSSQLRNPSQLAVDIPNNQLYIAETAGFQIRVVTFSNGNINGAAGVWRSFGSNNGAATSAKFFGPSGVALDTSHNRLYIADQYNNLIRMLDRSSNTVSTLWSSNLNMPMKVVYDHVNNQLLVADTGDNVIRVIDIAGNSMNTMSAMVALYSGDKGPSTVATLNYPKGINLDSYLNILYIADSNNNAIRAVNITTNVIYTFAGTGTSGFSGDGGSAKSATLNGPQYVSVDSLNNLVYIADSGNHVVRVVVRSTGYISTVAGIGTNNGFSGDGAAATSCLLNSPSGVAVDNINNVLYISDTGNHVIRTVNLTSGDIFTFAGTGTSNGYSGDGGPAVSAQLDNPQGATLDRLRNLLYIPDKNNHIVRVVDIASGIISTFAGTPQSGGFSGDNSAATSAQLNNPTSVYVDSVYNQVYIADSGNNA